ncbi:hypothetical protein BH10CYA1_BH10CYA1_59500 [soil metagenome]
MKRAVVKWSYLKGASSLGQAKAHINYIQYRDGKDREKGPREFFNEGRDPVLGRDIKARLNDLEQRGVQIHKIILSPGVECVDMKEYTREMMDNLSRFKGLDLEWYAVEHRNTHHVHTHVVVMGTDLDGQKVQLGREDSQHLRTWGDKYLEREHQLDKYLDREIEQLLEAPERVAELKYKRSQGDRDYERWMYGDKTDKQHNGEAERDRYEWEVFEDGLHDRSGPERSFGPRITYKQYQTESAGQLLDFHEWYQEKDLQKYWQNIAEQFPELAHDARRELKWINDHAQNRRQDEREPDLDQLLTGRDENDRFIRDFIEQEVRQLEREGVVLTDDHNLSDKEQKIFDNLQELFRTGFGTKEEWQQELQRAPVTEHEVNDWRASIGLDPLSRQNHAQERDDERDRGDDLRSR